jgi:hypothetical protein
VLAAPEAEPAPSPWAQIDLTGSLADATRRGVRGRAHQARDGAQGSGQQQAARVRAAPDHYKMLLSKLREHRLE